MSVMMDNGDERALTSNRYGYASLPEQMPQCLLSLRNDAKCAGGTSPRLRTGTT
jgi:hypothetical protein